MSKFLGMNGKIIRIQHLIVLFFALIFCYACQSNDDETIEKVKKQLCNKSSYHIDDTAMRCPDSINVIALKQKGLYLFQSFYGAGCDGGVFFNLVEIKKKEFTILDTFFCDWHDDLFIPQKIKYDTNNDWFIGISEGWGSGHYSEHLHIVRVSNNKLITLLEFPKYSSNIDFESETEPFVYVSIATKIKKADKKQIILHSVFEEGIINKNDSIEVKKQIEDEAVFIFADTCNCFVWQKSTNPKFEKVWKGKDIYPE